MWRNDKCMARKKNAELKNYFSQTGNLTNNSIPVLSERDKLIISTIGKETSEGIGVGEAGFGAATLVLDDVDEYEYVELEVKIII